MRNRLEVESAELAAAFRSADRDEQERVAAQMVERALAAQEPLLEFPADRAMQDALVDELDTSADEADFRRARAAAAARFLRQAAYEDALYEALHARPSTRDAVREARDQLG
jgi:hypothetical protein